MSNLILNSLEIRNFRGFRQLKIERLGRVNLIVGKNNVGKSSLLEALYLYAHRGVPNIIWDILGMRDESKLSFSSRYEEVENQLSALKYLFYGRDDVRTHLRSIRIGPMNSPSDTISITVTWYKAVIGEPPQMLQVREQTEYSPFDKLIPRLAVQIGDQQTSFPFNGLGAALSKPIPCIFIGAEGLDRRQVSELWDSITLRPPLDKEVIAALRTITPGAEGLSFVDAPTTSQRERVPIVKIEDIDEPIPLRSLGDGMQRMLGIALSLANAKDGLVLIDEIENGIHYSVQPELWQLIFQLASRLNVQVFATTHSWDCIEAFQKAAQEDKQEEGVLIRLSIKNDEVIAILFDERKLGIATREQVEVR